MAHLLPFFSLSLPSNLTDFLVFNHQGTLPLMVLQNSCLGVCPGGGYWALPGLSDALYPKKSVNLIHPCKNAFLKNVAKARIIGSGHHK